MTVFLTLAEFKARISEKELLSLAGTGQWNSLEGVTVDDGKVQSVLDIVNGLISGYVLARYPSLNETPIADQPPTLKDAGFNIARYKLRSEDGNPASITEDVRHRHNDAVSLLKQIQRDQYDLMVPGQVSPASAGAGHVLTGSSHPNRIDALLEGYR